MKIKWRVSIVMMVLCLTMILLESSIMVIRLKENIEKEYNDTIEKMCIQTGIAFSYSSDNIEQLLFRMCNSEGIASKLQYYETNYSQNLQVNSFLKSLTESTEYIMAAYLVDEHTGNIFCYTRNDVQQKKDLFLADFEKGLFDSSKDIKWFSNEAGEIFLRRAFYNLYPYQRVGSVIVNIDREKMLSMVGIPRDEAGSICIFDYQNDLVLNAGADFGQKELFFTAYETCVQAPNSFVYVEYQGEQYDCYGDIQERNGWNTIYLIKHKKKMISYNSINASIWAVGICLGIVSIVASFILSYSLTRRISNMSGQLKQIGDGIIEKRISISGKDEIRDLGESFNQMLDKLEDAYQSLIEHQIMEDKVRYELLNLQIRSVHARIAPHFISNLLAALSSYATIGETEKVEQLAVCASRYLRKNIESYDRFFCTVEEEFQTIDDYIYLYQCVFGQPHRYKRNFATETAETVMMPCLLLQPLVENSLKYYRNENGLDETQISLTAQVVEDRLWLILEDTSGAVPKDVLDAIEEMKRTGSDSTHRLGFGLSGILQRLQYMYGNDFEFEIQNMENRHKTITITIPTLPPHSDILQKEARS